MPIQPNEAFFAKGYELLKDRARRMAGQVASDEGAKKLSEDEISTLWNERAMPLEQEWELHRARQADGTPTYTPEQIGLLVFPKREQLAKSGGRLEPNEVTAWANRRAEKEAAKRAAANEQMPPLGSEVR